MSHAPPLTLTPRLIDLLCRISEAVGRWEAAGAGASPKLRRENRIRTIHSSLAIEANSLSLDQVTAILAGRRVRGLPREIKEVQNAFATYELLETLKPASTTDFLKAHRALMQGLETDAGAFRKGGVGIYKGTKLVHMAPPADRVPHLVKDLFQWLKKTDLHPLLAAAVVHYEIEFIHPFADGNGRIGRLWQTLVLSAWKSQLAYLPMETVVHDRQAGYYKALAASDQAADAAPFTEFILGSLLEALEASPATDQVGDQVGDQVSDQVSDQVKRLLSVFGKDEALAAAVLMERLGLKHLPAFRRNYLKPTLALGLIRMTQPDSPNSPTQRYRLASQR
jgi:Fic family protein